MANRLARLLCPSSIAVFGGAAAERVIHACETAGYTGAIWPVHPRRDRIGGLSCYRRVEELPDAPDAVFIGVNRELTVALVEQLAARGSGGAVCYASGFAETGPEGAALQQRLVAAAGGMPILGPNCYGYINYLDGCLLWPDQHGGIRRERGVAILAQSSNIALNLTMQRRGLPLACLVALGNQAQTGLSVLIENLAEDDRISALGLHIEGLDHPVHFARAVAAARRAGKPVVVLKVGRSDHSTALTRSHTAALAGSDAALSALLDWLGVPRVKNLPELLETLKLLHVIGPLRGPDVVSLSCSGGEAALLSDTARDRKLNLRPFTPEETTRIRATVHPLVSLSNPFDYHTFDWADATRLEATFRAVLDCNRAADRFDLSLLILDLPRGDRCDPADWETALNAWTTAACDHPAAVLATLPENLPEDRAEALIAAGIAPLLGMDEAVVAIEAAIIAGRVDDADDEPTFEPFTVRHGDGTPQAVDEWTAKQWLARYGIRIPEGVLCHDLEAVRAAATRLRFPLVAKAVGPELLHKSERGAVYLGLADPRAVEDAFHALRPLGDAVLVEEMITGGTVELLLAIRHDPCAGACLVIGLGGVLAELLDDVALLPLPTDAERIEQALARLRGARLLDGFRGRPEAAKPAIVYTALALQTLALTEGEWLAELEINPLIVGTDDAVAVDAVMQRVTTGNQP